MVKNVNRTARLQWKVDTIKNCKNYLEYICSVQLYPKIPYNLFRRSAQLAKKFGIFEKKFSLGVRDPAYPPAFLFGLPVVGKYSKSPL